MPPVNRRKTSSRAKTVKRTSRSSAANKNSKPNKGWPLLAILLATLLMAFIGYFIFAVDKPEPAPVVKAPVTKKEELLPEKPQPKWEYEKTLKEKEIEIDVPVEKKSTDKFQMQCGSFRKNSDAEALKASIAFQGLNSQVKHTGNWYRVILGPYERKRLAEKDRHKLQRAKINGCQIWLWR